MGIAFAAGSATTACVVCVFCLANSLAVTYCAGVPKLRRPFLSDRYFFVSARLHRRRTELTEPDFAGGEQNLLPF
jgi:hypothetical protein